MTLENTPFTHVIPVATLHGDTHLKLAPDAQERAAMAKALDLAGIDSLLLEGKVSHASNGLVSLQGTLRAAVRPVCVVTLEAFEQALDVPVSLRFAPETLVERMVRRAEEDGVEDFEAPDVIENGEIDFGQVATEFLSLSLDPYPRKPGAVFSGAGDPETPKDKPFAALAALKDRL